MRLSRSAQASRSFGIVVGREGSEQYILAINLSQELPFLFLGGVEFNHVSHLDTGVLLVEVEIHLGLLVVQHELLRRVACHLLWSGCLLGVCQILRRQMSCWQVHRLGTRSYTYSIVSAPGYPVDLSDMFVN